MENRTEHSRNDEIDLVDILAVLIRRKWIIIGLVLISLIISGIYVKFFSKTTTTDYKTTVNIQSPQIYNIDKNNLLQASAPDLNEFILSIKESLSTFSADMNERNEETLFVYSLTQQDPLLTIQLTGNRENISTAIPNIYKIYQDFSLKLKDKNENLYELVQTTIEQNLAQKKQMIKNLSMLLNNITRTQLTVGPEYEILYMKNALNTDIIKLEKIKGLNEESSLQAGVFEVSGRTNSLIVTDKLALTNIGSYIYHPEKSKKRQLLPVIVSVFLAFFVGIFLAFVIEFFSREDVKKRLREATKNK